MISHLVFKGLEAIQLESDTHRALVLPSLGGKLASFYSKEKQFELLDQSRSESYKLAEFGADFAQFDTSGFDDCFPSIDPSTETYHGKPVLYPDHGEIWSARFSAEIKDEALYLSYTSEVLPYTFKKSVRLLNNQLHIDYKIYNHGPAPIEGFYTVHCLMRCEEDMVLTFPPETQQVMTVMDSSTLGERGSVHPYPLTRDHADQPHRLDRVAPASASKCEKFYVTDPIKTGRCSAYYPSKGVTFTLDYDPTRLPYLGFWLTEGGFKQGYNCAFEPSNGFYDAMATARENGKLGQIAPDSCLEFSLALVLD